MRHRTWTRLLSQFTLKSRDISNASFHNRPPFEKYANDEKSEIRQKVFIVGRQKKSEGGAIWQR